MTEYPSEQDFRRLDAQQFSQGRQSETRVQSLAPPLPSLTGRLVLAGAELCQ